METLGLSINNNTRAKKKRLVYILIVITSHLPGHDEEAGVPQPLILRFKTYTKKNKYTFLNMTKCNLELLDTLKI